MPPRSGGGRRTGVLLFFVVVEFELRGGVEVEVFFVEVRGRGRGRGFFFPSVSLASEDPLTLTMPPSISISRKLLVFLTCALSAAEVALEMELLRGRSWRLEGMAARGRGARATRFLVFAESMIGVEKKKLFSFFVFATGRRFRSVAAVASRSSS